MKKVLITTAVIIVALVASFLIIYPLVEINTGEKLIRCSYSDDFSEYDVNHSYREVYCYNEKHDVSIKTFDVKKFLFFYTITMEYVEGDVRATEHTLEESYITHFIENADIYDNEKNVDVAELIRGKKAIVGNKRYRNTEHEICLFYILDGKEEEMYIFHSDDLLVIQVGSPDEVPRYIAYK